MNLLLISLMWLIELPLELLNFVSVSDVVAAGLCVLEAPKLSNFLYSKSCGVVGGVERICWIRYQDIDWEGMFEGINLDPDAGAIVTANAYIDTETECVLDILLNAGCAWGEVQFDPKQARYDFTYTGSDGFFTNVVSIVADGASKERRLALCDAIRQCEGIVMLVWGNNCNDIRLLGAELAANKCRFKPSLTDNAPDRILSTSDLIGQGNARTEVDFSSETICEPLFVDAAIESSLVKLPE